MQTTLIIELEAKADSLAELHTILASVRETLPGTKGCRDFRILQSPDTPAKVTLIEEWSSRAAHQAHISDLVASGGWDALAALLASAPVSTYYEAA